MKKIIVAISGASGAIYGIRLLEILKEIGVESHLIMSKTGMINIEIETEYKASDVLKLADFTYHYSEVGARISSGSFRTSGMIIAPCSMKTLSAISNAYEENLIIRAASVILKERKKLILLAREFPLSLSHIDSMRKITEMGGIIAPPVPAFYNKPSNIKEIIDHTIYRSLDLLDIELDNLKRWEGIKKL